jgi:hypothetical protein
MLNGFCDVEPLMQCFQGTGILSSWSQKKAQLAQGIGLSGGLLNLACKLNCLLTEAERSPQPIVDGTIVSV